MAATEYAFVNLKVLMVRDHLAAAYRDGGVMAVVEAAFPTDQRAWALAMTAAYGPRNVLDHHCDEYGRPSLAARFRFPALDQVMKQAHRDLLTYLGI